MYDPFDEYPHTIEVGKMQLVGKYPNQRKDFVPERQMQGFMDTPTTSETLKFHQMNKTFDRNLYTRYELPINKDDVFKYEGRIYQVVGYPVDQGGMHEVNLTRLQEVPNGQS
ncbi:phage head-tail adapter protein [Staphylococcus condimenti]|uniref:Phage head closure protein n=1 Tax=Staphylococcus condimenti TaxID=70255 RepID=A0AB37HB64_9STAP|nr:phage head closure protein [Staphylococcus condimenti]AMY05230.1 phage head-tail adapter protein [Staphylococcus condimenti]APR61424.1 phage head-tail adapter protein [Staphylococcus condimenti]MDK8646312.1 phage head closure protein [Staphylococcus condimenti]PNZ58440.1 phage head-tail adapter protein [Staphylococcus condimenti]QQS82965.1 phage head closure protein [Staphylococcus condimenti]